MTTWHRPSQLLTPTIGRPDRKRRHHPANWGREHLYSRSQKRWTHKERVIVQCSAGRGCSAANWCRDTKGRAFLQATMSPGRHNPLWQITWTSVYIAHWGTATGCYQPLGVGGMTWMS